MAHRDRVQTNNDLNLILEEVFAVQTMQLYFLGTLDIRYDNQPLPKPPTLKSQSLLAYLILHRHRPQPRERLAGLIVALDEETRPT